MSREATMEPFSRLILEIYRAAREMPTDLFQDFVLGLVNSLTPFDSSRWVTVELFGKQATTHNVHLVNEPTDIVLDWDAINRQDRLLHAVTDNPGKAFNIHSKSEYQGRDYAEIRDYAQRYHHSNVLCIAQFTGSPNHVEGLSLFRARSDNHFQDEHRAVLEQLMPHMVEAVTTNRALNLAHGGVAAPIPERSTVAIAGLDGRIRFAGSGFNKQLRLEWPAWTGLTLPDLLLRSLSRAGARDYTGKMVSVACSHADGLLFLRASRLTPLHRLSKRERVVAQLYGTGCSYKEISSQLGITPATVRNFLQRIYTKLDIGDKAALATLIGQNDA